MGETAEDPYELGARKVSNICQGGLSSSKATRNEEGEAEVGKRQGSEESGNGGIS